MNNEIKEINIKWPGQILEYVDTQEHLLELFNHITNLRQEKDYYFKKNNELSTLNTSLRSDRDNYKKRIEKAVEYIKEHSQMTDLNIYGIENVLSFRGSVDDLLNILNGRSDE